MLEKFYRMMYKKLRIQISSLTVDMLLDKLKSVDLTSVQNENTEKQKISTGRSSHSAIIHNPHYEITTPSGHGDR